MTATPKHRLRATVTTVYEYDMCAFHDDARRCAKVDRCFLEGGGLDGSLTGLDELGEPTRTVKVEVIR